ncbi:MAG TPA: isoprenylcysteine carboxylmethyltransferase family protein [Anaerolineae bacterium]|nr:isoprenylcysteine carboxylmethyltransferase family protein [Anaerolineae bacterium]
MDFIISALVLTGYFGLYAVAHTWLASLGVKAWVRRRFGPAAARAYRLAYNVVATVTLLPLLALLALLPQQTLYVVPAPWAWLMVVGQLVAILAAGLTLLQTGALDFLGLAQLFGERAEQNGGLNLGGLYAWVRHPLYTCSLIFLWLSPAMTTNSLVAYLLFTLYFYIGSIYEERRLVVEFGATYRAYQQAVPRLIPRLGRRYMPSSEVC